MSSTNPNKRNETTRVVRLFYTDAERLELGRKLAEERNAVAQITADNDRVKTEFKSRITAHEASIADLANKVSSGYRMESTKCLWSLDQPAGGKKELRRLDTSEVIETSEMTEADKQSLLPLDAPAPAEPTGVATDGTATVAADGPAIPDASK